MRHITTLVLASLFSLSSLAASCVSDLTPAATLLFPFLSFDYEEPFRGSSTNIAITNFSSEAQIVHFTLYSDLGIPMLEFNIVLSGYDVETINLRDLLLHGKIPETGTSGANTVNGAVPTDQGPVYATLGIMPDARSTSTLADRCPDTALGYPAGMHLDESALATIRDLLELSQTLDRSHSDCATGEILVDNEYLTVPENSFQDRRDGPIHAWAVADVVETCERGFADNSASYWNETIRHDNVLFGDVIWTDDLRRMSEASHAVHIESVPAEDLATDASGDPITFYGWLDPTGANLREPLPTVWASRFFGSGIDELGTSLRVFKLNLSGPNDLERLADGSLTASSCLAYTYYVWDEDESTYSIPMWAPPGGDYRINRMPLITQEISVDELPNLDEKGWLMMAWPPSNIDALDLRYQAWVETRFEAFGNYSAGMSAIPVGNANCRPDEILGNLN